jgi:4-hydroxy-2-oxoheptanedioate aldolase
MYSGHSFGAAESVYAQNADKELLVIVQIESRQGVDNVEEIAAVDGLDCLFIGESSQVKPSLAVGTRCSPS